MQLFSSSSPKSQFPLFSPSPNHNPSKIHFRFPIRTLHPSSPLRIPPCSSKDSFPSLEEKLLFAESSDEDEDNEENKEKAASEQEYTRSSSESPDGLLVVRRPVMELSAEETDVSSAEIGEGDDSEEGSSSSAIDAGLSEFAKKMPIFEPERVELSSEQKPLGVNLELALYRAKILARKYQFEEAEKILRQCIFFWPEDGRPYVALGKILSKQSKSAEAREVYEKGCQATQGENPYIWQCWAVLESKMGNVRRARELFDAATVADKRHIAAWHGWAILELKQGNVKKARNLLGKGLKYCGGNEYIYQTLALLEAKANRIEQARYLFKQATKCNPKSCASWLAWAQLEMQQENNHLARKLFERAIQASPKNRFAWHVWGIFEANLGNIDKGRKLLKIGHTLNPRDPVLLQSLALLEYKHSTANLARVLFRRAAELDPRHQPVWIAWGVLEQRLGNLSAARRLFRSSLNINSQSYITWMTWASLEEEQGNSVRAEEIRNLYFQQRTEVVDDDSWVMGFLDIIDPALDSIKRLLNFESNKSYSKGQDGLRNINGMSSKSAIEESEVLSSVSLEGKQLREVQPGQDSSDFDLDAFVHEKLSLDVSNLEVQIDASVPKKIGSSRRVWRSQNKAVTTSVQP
ncbi:PREDICTED: protein high chlorophyll fluorescent 107 isoform X2 [Nelumbo nucifera]|uniref:Protein high chlorophyll fluorescent 107 isoform X2 n=1 Tax=Nelumbo nucifera TaxID=4432 RepID=A0A1U8AB14_NELNU|nr:PREDICTED: protein high chlorophyll fluorescent 107 isoform X2 [Nelumbo nucifera]